MCLIFDYLKFIEGVELRKLIVYIFKNDGNSKLNAVLHFPDNMPFSNVSNYRCFLTCVCGIGCAKKVLHSPISLSNVELLIQTHYGVRPCAYRL